MHLVGGNCEVRVHVLWPTLVAVPHELWWLAVASFSIRTFKRHSSFSTHVSTSKAVHLCVIGTHCEAVSEGTRGSMRKLGIVHVLRHTVAVLAYSRLGIKCNRWAELVCLSVTRPMNRILIAQNIARPQMYIAVLVLPVHIALAWLTVLHWRWGLAFAAYVQVFTLALTLALTASYICWARLQSVTWGKPSRSAFQVAFKALQACYF